MDKLSKLKMGNALDETSDIGAIISEEQLKRTLYYMDIAKKNSSTKISSTSSIFAGIQLG